MRPSPLGRRRHDRGVSDGTDRIQGFAAERVTARLDLELSLIADAIELVRRDSSQRVTVAGIRFGSELLERARALAAQAGLRASGLYGADESGTDLVIERVSDPGAV